MKAFECTLAQTFLDYLRFLNLFCIEETVFNPLRTGRSFLTHQQFLKFILEILYCVFLFVDENFTKKTGGFLALKI